MKFTQAAALGAAAVLVCAPSAASASAAAAKLSLSKTSGLAVGDTVNVTSLTGLKANLAQVYVAQCKKKVAGPTDCELSSALSGNADASGTWKSSKGTAIKLVKTIGGVDCTSAAGACIIGVTSLTNPGDVIATASLTFGGSSTDSNDDSNDANDDSNDSGTPGSNNDDTDNALPQTGSPDGVPTFALAASALVLTGAAALFLVPRRRRTN
ncbi:neocarzinostatin apoprotein domain-containing protein [Actinocorallia populi]|uniref:neocarzinostatin apoprotein domain-containing protein n=1 Tax=Actinocorallia populi TaxID=2079200 RepID=UPI000D092C36|nr:neocarzinostatin apoprotein domain-containing protein [Actinocorallia populi]